jgi:hypothetical protein
MKLPLLLSLLALSCILQSMEEQNPLAKIQHESNLTEEQNVLDIATAALLTLPPEELGSFIATHPHHKCLLDMRYKVLTTPSPCKSFAILCKHLPFTSDEEMCSIATTIVYSPITYNVPLEDKIAMLNVLEENFALLNLGTNKILNALSGGLEKIQSSQNFTNIPKKLLHHFVTSADVPLSAVEYFSPTYSLNIPDFIDLCTQPLISSPLTDSQTVIEKLEVLGKTTMQVPLMSPLDMQNLESISSKARADNSKTIAHLNDTIARFKLEALRDRCASYLNPILNAKISLLTEIRNRLENTLTFIQY